MVPPASVSTVSFDQQGAILESRFEFDLPSNLLTYQVSLATDNRAEIYAVTLVIDAEQGDELNDPIVLNLMGPETDESSGTYFMSPQFRQAYAQERVYLKVFADVFPVTGAAQGL